MSNIRLQSFVRNVRWGKLYRFQPLISKEDMAYFEEKVNHKISESKEYYELPFYRQLKRNVKYFKDNPEECGSEINELEEYEKIVNSLEYIGIKQNHTFSFNLKDIINPL